MALKAKPDQMVIFKTAGREQQGQNKSVNYVPKYSVE